MALGDRHRVDREGLAEALERTQGNVLQAAHELGADRSTVFTWIRAWRLWPLVNALREERRRRRGRIV